MFIDVAYASVLKYDSKMVNFLTNHSDKFLSLKMGYSASQFAKMKNY